MDDEICSLCGRELAAADKCNDTTNAGMEEPGRECFGNRAMLGRGLLHHI